MTLSTVFLDRDGTVNVKAPEGEYVSRPDDLVLLPGAADAVARLNRAGVFTVLVTNQRGVATGRMSQSDVEATHARLADLLATAGARLDAVYVCPHERDSCRCRKPSPGMVEQAVREHPEIDLTASALVGDADSDVRLGEDLGLRTVRIGPRQAHDLPGTLTAPSLAVAVDLLLERSAG